MCEIEQLESTIAELKLTIGDMNKVAKTHESAGIEILNMNSVSNRGLKRVLKSVLSYPNPPAQKAITDEEGALIRVIFDKMKLNLQMYHLVIHLEKLEKQLIELKEKENGI